MKRLLLISALIGTSLASIRLPMVTYYRDVLPILQQHCISCHRPAQIAPISFVTYRETRLWAEEIKHVVLTARMPPWSGGFPADLGQDHHLMPNEVETIIQWVDGGALAGSAGEAPPPSYPEQPSLRPGETPKDR